MPSPANNSRTQLEGYEEAERIASRSAAAKTGYFNLEKKKGIMEFFRGLWEKRESASSHFAWGLALELAFVIKGAAPETAFVAVILASAAWEIGGEVLTHKFAERIQKTKLGRMPGVWRSRALDVPPWILGAAAGWVFLSL